MEREVCLLLTHLLHLWAILNPFACLSACHTQVYIYIPALIWIYSLYTLNTFIELIYKKRPPCSLFKISICHKACKRSANQSASSLEGRDSSFSVKQLLCRSECSDLHMHIEEIFFFLMWLWAARVLWLRLLLIVSSFSLKS